MTERDTRAREILLRTYWSSSGWRDPPVTEPEDLEYACAAGVMFEGTISKTHDEVVGEVVSTVREPTSSSISNNSQNMRTPGRPRTMFRYSVISSENLRRNRRP